MHIRNLAATVVLSAACLSLTAVTSNAATTTAPTANPTPAAQISTPAAPDPSKNSMLETLIQNGGKVFYLGTVSGLDGWFIAKDKQAQIAYTTGDGNSILVGALFGKDGQNISAGQIDDLTTNNKDFSQLVMEMNKQAQSDTSNIVGNVPSSPGEKLAVDLGKALGVELGSNVMANQVFMVINPEQPDSIAAWKILRDSVFKGTIRLRLIPVGSSSSVAETEGLALLMASDPATSWDRFANGDKSQLALATTPAQVLLDGIRANQARVDNWSIHTLPCIVYRAKNGKVMIVQGKIASADTILSDLP